MTKKEELEEMESELCYMANNPYDYDTYEMQAWNLVEERGWHKQTEGTIIEIIKEGKMNRTFSCCNKDCTELTKWLIPDYCPYCGARIISSKEV
jgi:hypothetical protein